MQGVFFIVLFSEYRLTAAVSSAKVTCAAYIGKIRLIRYGSLLYSAAESIVYNPLSTSLTMVKEYLSPR